jgi:hypothetical protein
VTKNRTQYTVLVNGETTDFTRSTKATAVAHAESVLGEKGNWKVEVVTQTGTVVFTATRRKPERFRAPAYTKTVRLAPEIAELVPEGYAAAYERTRNGTVVLRREADIEDDDSRYAVLDVVAQELVGYAETTRAAGAIMKALGAAKSRVKA